MAVWLQWYILMFLEEVLIDELIKLSKINLINS